MFGRLCLPRHLHFACAAYIDHWRGREITLEVDPEQDVWIDGESNGQTPLTTTDLHQALEIVVPA